MDKVMAAARELVIALDDVMQKHQALKDALAPHDAFQAKEKAMREEAERTGNWTPYQDWVRTFSDD